MLTDELKPNKMCLFCASDYHLEMILLPYIKERIETMEFVIFTQNNLDETMKKVLNRVNIDDDFKSKIININWNNEDEEKFKLTKEFIKNNKKFNIIVNGEYDYIKEINNNLKTIVNEEVDIVDCFHVSDTNINIDALSKNYKYILNTKKI